MPKRRGFDVSFAASEKVALALIGLLMLILLHYLKE